MPEHSLPGRPETGAAYNPEPPLGGEQPSPPPGRGPGGGDLSGTVLGFDFGTERIGVAVGESLLGQARALTTIASPANDARFAAIGKLVAEWQPARLVVGLPLALDGTEHEMTARCRRFAHQLEGRFRLPVELVDERLTSVEAERTIKPGRHGRDRATKAKVDAEAARLILQDWFAHAHAHTA
jgi:putative Holliday junction resolvase